jgi:histidyl-tRNA synthetase
MALITTAPRGTQDLLPENSFKNQWLESTLAKTAADFGFSEIRFPTFEHTELFNRSVGDTTDIVQKEMYTFEDKGNRSITLKPEGTAGAVRMLVENKLFNDAQPTKMYYLNCPVFRYEKPQAGRLREHHQFGVEVFGAPKASADAECIVIALELFKKLGVRDLALNINSIGCPECRPRYHEALKAYLMTRYDELCETCKTRFEKKPLRVLDCKEEKCKEIAADAPHMIDYLCPSCSEHMDELKAHLNALDIPYAINPFIVRGLDYYTKTVFEIISNHIGSQGTVCGGGRYDGLVAELGGNSVPACGFGMGIERLKLLLEAQGVEFPEEKRTELYIAPAKEAYSYEAMRLTELLRREGVNALTDVSGRSLKAQMKFANKKEAMFTLVLGDEEMETGKAKVKNMADGSETELRLDRIQEDITGLLVSAMFGGNGEPGALSGLTLLDGGKK